MDAKRRVAISSVAAACLLTGAKLGVGLWTGSLGILSEAAHSALDLLAAGLTWWAVTVSDRPADRDHPYGHEKIENLSALLETLLLLVTCVWIVYEAVARLYFKTVEVEVNAWSFGVVLLAIAVDVSRSRALSRVARETRSKALEADALHFSSDILSSLVVLGGLAFTLMGYPQADAIAAIGVSLFVVWISIRLGMRSVDALTDRVPGDHVGRVARAAQSVPGVARAYDVRVREAGARHFVDLKVGLDPGMPLETAHGVTEAVERAVQGALSRADVLVHAEPEGTPLSVEEATRRIREAVQGIPEVAGCSEAVLLKSREGTHAVLTVSLPGSLSFAEAHAAADRIEQEVRQAIAGPVSVTVHAEPADAVRRDPEGG
ncbi:MAG: cation-efflux pump [Acidobacteriota bacterium]